MKKTYLKKILGALFVMAIFLILFLPLYIESKPIIDINEDILRVYYFNVGQADCTLDINNGQTLLIDEENEKTTQIGLFDGGLTIKSQREEKDKTKIIENKTKLIRRNQDIKFRYLNISNLKSSNQRTNGIKNVVYELRHMSIYNQYRHYPTAYCFLIRSMLEQSSIYFLINLSKWDKLKEGNNDKDLRLEQIINYISKNKGNLINDETILKCWETCFNSLGTKNYLDLVIHHPEQVTANIEAIRNITDMGLYAIIQHFLNS